jgi:hypothetical protein
MSKEYRAKLINELLSLDRRKVSPEHQFGDAYVDSQMLDGLIVKAFATSGDLSGVVVDKELTKAMWPGLKRHLLKTCNGYKTKNWSMKVSIKNDIVHADFSPLSTPDKQRVNVQEAVSKKLKTEIANYIVGPGVKVLFNGMTAEHGTKPDVDQMEESNDQGGLFPRGMGRKYGTNITQPVAAKVAAKQRARTSRSSKSYAVAAGAAGTITEQKIRTACKNAAKEFQAMSKPMQGNMTVMLAGWMEEIFEVQDDLKQDFSTTGINAECRVKLLIAGTVEGANGPEISKFIQDEFRKAFDPKSKNGKRKFRELARRMTNLSAKEADQLWGASKGPVTKGKAIAKKKVIDALFPHKTRADMRLKVNKAMFKDAKKQKRKSKNTVKTASKASTRKVSIAGAAVVARKATQAPKSVATAKTSASPVALRNMLNAVLPQEVASRMSAPALQFRTGRFANSARVENVLVGPRGGTQIEYSYMRNPYETFEPGGKQGSTNRDPRRIIGASIREIATGIIGNRFTLRRI